MTDRAQEERRPERPTVPPDGGKLGGRAPSPYVLAVSLAGMSLVAAVIAHELRPIAQAAGLGFWVLAACVLVGELVPLKVVRRGAEGETNSSTPFSFALLLTAGAPAATLVLALASLTADLIHRKPLQRGVFNAAQYALALAAAGWVFARAKVLLHAPAAVDAQWPFPPSYLLPYVLGAAVFFALNTALVTGAIADSRGDSFRSYLIRDLALQAGSAAMLLGLAPVIVVATARGMMMLPLLALPLLAVHRSGQQALLNQAQALHDALTGLPNRVLFREHVDQAIELAHRRGDCVAVMLMDLDRFKEINDTLGHHDGDLLLRKIGPRLREALGPADVVARLGGDEFAIVLPNAGGPEQARELAGRLRALLVRPFAVADLSLEIGGSIGIACSPQHGQDAQTLIQRADIAMYLAKASPTGVDVYSAEHDQYSPERLDLISDLRRALEHEGELVVHYQPKVELSSGRIESVEALLRWQHPQRGLISPADFIPIAEHTGLIAPITFTVLEQVLRQVERWQAAGLRLRVAVNLSARSLLDRALPAEIAALIERSSASASALELEITESMIMSDPGRALEILRELHAMGVTLAIDDFGTGYSSLTYLKELPVDTIKIDRSFVQQMSARRSDAMIVRSTIDLSRNLGLRVVAEGVEDPATLAQLRALGCDEAQGFVVSRALSAAGFDAWLAGFSFAALLDEAVRAHSLQRLAAPPAFTSPTPTSALSGEHSRLAPPLALARPPRVRVGAR